MSKVFVKPSRAGLKVRHPDMGGKFFIPVDGMEVEKTPGFIRLISCGDLVVVSQPGQSLASDDKTKGAK